MFMLKFLLTLLNSENDLSKMSNILSNSSVCASRVIVKHELCANRECLNPVLLNTTEFHVSPSLCKKNMGDAQVCTTKDCIQAAATVISNIDNKAKPCDNFFQYACGNFITKTNIKEFGFVDESLKANEAIRLRLWNQVESPITPDEPHVNLLIKKIYQACLNTKNLISRGPQPLLTLLKRIGGWPVLEGDAWNGTDFSWTESVYRCRREGCSTNYFMKFGSKYFENPKKGLYPFISFADLELKKDVMSLGMNSEACQNLYNFMVKTAVLLGANHTLAVEELKDVINFEKQIAIKIPSKSSSGYILTIKELKEKIKLDWLAYINELSRPNVYDTDSLVGVDDIFYITDIMRILESTPKRVIANYLGWRVVSEKLLYLTDDFQYELPTKPRKQICRAYLIKNFPIALGAVYVRQYFNQPLKDLSIDIFKEVIEQFRSMVMSSNWVKGQTKKVMLNRLDSMNLEVAFPFDLIYRGILDEYYEKLHFSSNLFFEFGLNLTLFNHDYVIKRPWDRDNKTNCIKYERMPEYNAFFEVCSVNRTIIAISAGHLRGLSYSLDYPYYMLFATIGSVIAREVSHGFAIEDWWSKEEKDYFNTQKMCFINQYQNYYANNTTKPIHASETALENIADTIGIKVAYRAMEKWIEKHGTGKVILGLEKFTANQIFWLFAANSMCAKFNQNVKLLRLNNKRSLNEFRVNGPFSNMEQFSKDFQCPYGSHMKNNNKCRIWS